VPIPPWWLSLYSRSAASPLLVVTARDIHSALVLSRFVTHVCLFVCLFCRQVVRVAEDASGRAVPGVLAEVVSPGAGPPEPRDQGGVPGPDQPPRPGY